MKKSCIHGVPGEDSSLIPDKVGSITCKGNSPWGVSSEGDGKFAWDDRLSSVGVSFNKADPSHLKAAMGSLGSEDRAEGVLASFWSFVSQASFLERVRALEQARVGERVADSRNHHMHTRIIRRKRKTDRYCVFIVGRKVAGQRLHETP